MFLECEPPLRKYVTVLDIAYPSIGIEQTNKGKRNNGDERTQKQNKTILTTDDPRVNLYENRVKFEL